MTVQSQLFLRRVLLIDAATCSGAGLFMSLGAAHLAPLFGLPRELLLYAGLGLFPVAAFLVATARSAAPAVLALSVIVAGNLAWLVASLGVLGGVAGTPTSLGLAFVAAQAAAVAVLTTLELKATVQIKLARRRAA